MASADLFTLKGSVNFCTSKGEIHVRKLVEGLSQAEVRSEVVLLLEEMLNESPLTLGHTSAGKPYLEGKESLHLSISHASGWIAVYVSERVSVGIDIEAGQEKIRKAASHFINEEEKLMFGDFSFSELHLIWGAKEAVYKYFGGAFTTLEREVKVLEIHDEWMCVDTVYGEVECFYKVLDGEVYLVWV